MTFRLVIAGGPRTGKTSLAQALLDDGAEGPVLHTDDLIDLGWSEASEAASRWLDEPGPWIVEGVAAGRALRKWLTRTPPGITPCDAVLYLDQPQVEISEAQERMRKGCRTVWEEIHIALHSRGVAFLRVGPEGIRAVSPARSMVRLDAELDYLELLALRARGNGGSA